MMYIEPHDGLGCPTILWEFKILSIVVKRNLIARLVGCLFSRYQMEVVNTYRIDQSHARINKVGHSTPSDLFIHVLTTG